MCLLLLPQVGVLLLPAAVRCEIRGVGWRGALFFQISQKHSIQQQRSIIGSLRSKKLTAIQQKKHVVAECVGASCTLKESYSNTAEEARRSEMRWRFVISVSSRAAVAVSCQIRMGNLGFT